MSVLSPIDHIKRYLSRTGLSTGTFAKKLGVSVLLLKRKLKGEEMGLGLIFKLSFATSTSPRFWYLCQAGFQFEQFFKKRTIPAIIPIAPKQQSASIIHPGRLILQRILSPLQMDISELGRLLNIRTANLLIGGKIKVSPVLAVKLEQMFKNDSALFWLQRQLEYDVSQHLMKFPEDLPWCKVDHFERLCVKRQPWVELQTVLAQKGSLAIEDWGRFFLISKNRWSAIIKGRSPIPVQLAVSLAKFLGGQAYTWLSIQLLYDLQMAKKLVRKLPKGPGRLNVFTYSHKSSALARKGWLYAFLQPMNWTIDEFSIHTGISVVRLKQINGQRIRIDFETAVVLGEALQIEPIYFVNLQTELDCQRHRL